MSFFGAWVGRNALEWLDRFRQRHGLQLPESPPDGGQSNSLTKSPGQPVLLHVGSGNATIADIIVPGFHEAGRGWQEIRLDADERVSPDIVGSMTDMLAVPDGFADAIFSSHGIEHLYWHDVPIALREFLRVLAADGFAVITCPDLQAAAQMIADDRVFETAYLSPAGPITPFDMIYSYRPYVAANPEWMSHHCGFTLTTLTECLRQAGFPSIYGLRRENGFDLWVLASKSPRDADSLKLLAAEYLPA
jgi:hypothetical protein